MAPKLVGRGPGRVPGSVFIWVLFLAVVLWGCKSGPTVQTKKTLVIPKIGTLFEGEYETTDYMKENPPRTVAVLPFANLTDKEEAFEVVRKAFYNHFSSLPYIDIEIVQVDERLKLADLLEPEKVNAADPVELGKIVRSDAVVYGEITEYDRVYLGVYSHVSVGAQLKMMDAKTGQLLWRGKHSEAIRAGGFSVSPVGLILTAISTAINVRTIQLYRCSDDLFREMVKAIPRPPLAKALMPPTITILVQDAVGSPKKAGDVVKVAMEGDPRNRAFFDIGDFKKRIPMQEEEKGVYVGEYRVVPGDNVADAIITGRLLDDQGNEAKWIDALGTVTLDTTPPARPKGLTALGRDRRVILDWKANEESDLAGYRVYRSSTPLTGFELLKDTEFRELDDVALKNGERYYYRVRAYDMAGNESEPSETMLGMPIKPGPTPVGGAIETDTVWSAAASPYILTDDVTVMERATLTLEPGCEVLSEGPGIVVKGKILAEGRPEARIFLAGKPIKAEETPRPPVEEKTGQPSAEEPAPPPENPQDNPAEKPAATDAGPRRAAWKGLVLDGSKGSSLSHCLIRDAAAGILLKSSSPRVVSCDLTDNSVGVLITESFSQPVISGCMIHENRGTGVAVRTGARPNLEQNEIRANHGLGVEVRDGAGRIADCAIVGNLGGGFSGKKATTVVTNCDIHDNGPFDMENLGGSGELDARDNYWGTKDVLKILERLRGRVNIASILSGPRGQGESIRLNILASPLKQDITSDAYLIAARSPYVVDAQVNIKAAVLYIQAGVEVRFNQSESVLVVAGRGALVTDGKKDAPVVFTANGKGAGAGFYTTAIRFAAKDQRDSTLKYCIFQYAATALDIHYGRPAVSYCVVRDNSQSGILSRNNSKPTITRSSIYRNMGTGGIEVYGNSSPTINLNNIFDNPFAIQSFSSIRLNARKNYWGKVPPDNSLFIGDVNYEEWLKSPVKEAFDVK